jgi:hypothetical protein
MKKSVSLLPLMALALGFGLMSFTTVKNANVRLYRLNGTTNWLTEAQLQALIGPEQEFVCLPSRNYCSSEFDENDTPVGETPAEAVLLTIESGDGFIQDIE